VIQVKVSVYCGQ